MGEYHAVCNNCKFWNELQECTYLSRFLDYDLELNIIHTPPDFFCVGYQRRKED